MQRLLSAACAVSAAFLSSGCVSGDWGGTPYRDTVSESRALAMDGRFTLENTNGRVEVNGWDEPRVSIEATRRARSQHALEDIEIEITGEGDSLRVKTRYARPRWMGGAGQVDYRVRVPRTARVSVANVNGRVEVDGIAAEVEASAVNGSVEVREAAGAIEASTVNGSVRASLTRLDPDGRSRLRATNGSVSLTLPSDANAELEARTVNGGIRCDFDLDDRHKTRRRLEGRIGSGGARFDLGTVNGSVSIDRGLSTRAARREAEETPAAVTR